MKIYRGVPGHMVLVDDGTNSFRQLPHRVRHSPTGFSWGYEGSGPADLARSILWDVLGASPHPALYQAFKRDAVAQWAPDESWEVSERLIRKWLAQQDGPRFEEVDG